MSIHSTKNTIENYTGKNERNSGTKDENKFLDKKSAGSNSRLRTDYALAYQRD
jgi:hypothetical protein